MLTARDKLFAYVRNKAAYWGMDPDLECVLQTPERAAKTGAEHFWRVMWESGPHNWGVDLSMDGVTFVQYDGAFDRSDPEVVMGNPEDWRLSPYYSFDVSFIPDNPYASFLFQPNQDSIVVVAGNVEQRLAAEIAKHPSLLSTVDRRAFERLIAELFNGLGYDVELTKQTRDGGKDIVIKSVDSVNLRYLIECKRPDPGNKVNVATVRELLGVKTDDPASKALLVTTTDFTKDARQLIDRHKWVLEGKAHGDVLSWINNYNSIKGAA